MPKALQKIFILFAIIAFFIASITVILVAQKLLPYHLTLTSNLQIKLSPLSRFIYYDLDHDGFEERIQLINQPFLQRYYIKVYQDYGRGLIDQFNFNQTIILHQPLFYDFNQDGRDEILIFSNDNNMLYYSIIDVFNIDYLAFEQPLIPASAQRAHSDWDIHSVIAQFVDFPNLSEPQLLFGVNSGYSKLPRCLCLYSFKQKKVLHRLDYHLGPIQLKVVDLNRDGKKEIAVVNASTNNFKPDVYLSDAFSWFLLLDEQLNFLLPPQQLADKFSYPYLLTIKNKNSTNILIPASSKGKWEWIKVDSTFQISRKKIPANTFYLTVNNQITPPQVYLSKKQPLVQIFNSELNLISEKELNSNHQKLIIGKIHNLLGDSLPEILAWNSLGFYVFNQKWELLAQYQLEKPMGIKDTYIIHQPNFSLPLIAFTGSDHANYRLKFERQNLYSKLQYLFLIILFGSFLLLVSGFWGIEKIWRYVSSFFYLLKGSDNAIILLDSRGHIVNVNKKVNHLLQLKKPLTRGLSIEDGLKQRLPVLEAIQESRNKISTVKKSISLEELSKPFIGEVNVTPFIGLFGYAYAFLVEIKDSTKQVLLERQRNWQRNIRKMVHDIKTPLAGVQLKLQMLFMQLEEEGVQLSDEFYQELDSAYHELKRIGNITKDFLKVSDLEQLKISKINLETFIKQALQPFNIYTTNAHTQIITRFKMGLPEYVYWDERQIELMIHILVENAIDAIQEKGEILLEIGPSAKVKNVKEPWIEIRIEDNGKGIPPEIRHKIFEPHFSTKAEGTGLGLTFARQIVLHHGGQIEFYSGLNSGTVFVVTLPSKVELNFGEN